MTAPEKWEPAVSSPDNDPPQKTGDEVEASAVDTIRLLVICVLGWAVPGLGHVASGRILRGALFAIIILTMFVMGLALDGKIYEPERGMPLSYLATIGSAGIGLPYVIVHALGLGGGDIRSGTSEYGNTFTLVAGLLNMLVIFDAYDVALGRR
jgi:hypothetical protein